MRVALSLLQAQSTMGMDLFASLQAAGSIIHDGVQFTLSNRSKDAYPVTVVAPVEKLEQLLPVEVGMEVFANAGVDYNTLAAPTSITDDILQEAERRDIEQEGRYWVSSRARRMLKV